MVGLRVISLVMHEVMESKHFSETERFAKRRVSRHETSQDISDWIETRRDVRYN